MKRCKNDRNGRYTGNEPSPKGLGICARGERIDHNKRERTVICGLYKKTME